MAVARVDVGTEAAGEEGASSGGQYDGAGTYRPRLVSLPAVNPGRPGHHPVGVDEQLQGRRLVQDAHPGAVDHAAHPPHVLGPLHAAAPAPSGLRIHAEGITPVHGQVVDTPVGLVEHPVHPGGFGEQSPFGVAAVDGRGTLGSGGQVPEVVAAGRGRTTRPAVTLVGEDHAAPGPGGRQRCPRAGRSPTEHEDVGVDLRPVRTVHIETRIA